MMRSLYSGVSGLKNHQTRMDVIGNNIANVNTVGYKTSRVVFQDIYSQTMGAGSGPNGAVTGGTNPRQIGLGMTIAAIDVMNTTAAPTITGAPLDVALQGEGYFVVNNGSESFYTRAGNFYIDSSNQLVSAGGLKVQGVMLVDPAKALDESVDASGNVTYTVNPSSVDPNAIDFKVDASDITIDPGFYEVSINKNGEVTGIVRGSGEKVIIAIIEIATFDNPKGLLKMGENLYSEGNNSGGKTLSKAGTQGAGSINPTALEMSNVDLAQEFTDMIVTQRGFQANSRIITVSDQMLEELINIKR